MPKKTKPFDEKKIAAAALQVAAKQGWAGLNIETVALAARQSPETAKEHCATPADIATLVVRVTAAQALANAGKAKGDLRDILFDRMMARFDELQKNRAGVLVIAGAARQDRALAAQMGRAIAKTFSDMIADVETIAPRPVAAAGLMAAYLWAFAAWRGDESQDMAKTMAALDRALRFGDRAVRFFRPRA